MSIIGSNILAGAAGSGTGEFAIEQSLRFNSGDTHYLNRTPGSAGNQQVFTISFWIKRQASGGEDICTGDDQNGFLINFQAQDGLYLYDPNAASGGFQIWSDRVFRDISAWYHIVVAVDSTQATDSNRVKVYINGEQENLATWNVGAGASRYPTQNANLDWNNTNSHEIGTSNNYGYLNGYLAEFYNIDGSALDADDFGESDDNGVWRPIRASGLTYGTNGFYLKFDPDATNGIGHDHSGNGNNFTANNFTTSGTGTDVVSDTPTSNFATLNPLIGYQVGGLLAPTYSNGNLTVAPQVSSGDNSRVAFATLARNPADGGVWRWEMVVNSTNNSFYGIQALSEYTGQGSFGPYWGASGLGGNLSVSGGASASLQEQHATISAGDVITIVVSFDDNEIGWYINGTRKGFYNGCNFSNYDQLVPFFKESTRTQTPCTFDVNFGQKAFQYTTSGDSWGDLSLLPAPDIADGSAHFNTVTYTGNDTTQSITGVGFQPDWVWIKQRNAGENHFIVDIIRGAGVHWRSDQLIAESDNSATFTSFDTDGFSLTGTGPAAPQVNDLNDTYVAWNWLAGNSTSSNTNGDINSTVSVNATAGFSIVSYTGNGSSNQTIGHGLGSQPAFVITKTRDQSSQYTGTSCYHKDLSTDYLIWLHSTNGEGNGLGNYFKFSLFSDTVFGVGNDIYGPNVSGEDYIAYCFAEVQNYSRIGKYVGNGNDDGPFIATSFPPAWLLIKRIDTDGYNWTLFDSVRRPYNVNNHTLAPNSVGGENTSGGNGQVDFLANGFKPRNTDGGINAPSATYIFVCLAEHPFGGDTVSPATAR